MTSTELPSLPLDVISRCSTISRELLRTFAPSSTPELLEWFSNSRLNSQLHVCSLVTQSLSLGLAFYTQAHAGPYSPFFLEDPLTDFTLTGSMDGCFHIKACLRELTCLRGMVDGPIFVFALLNPDLLMIGKSLLNHLLHSTFVAVELILRIPGVRACSSRDRNLPTDLKSV